MWFYAVSEIGNVLLQAATSHFRAHNITGQVINGSLEGSWASEDGQGCHAKRAHDILKRKLFSGLEVTPAYKFFLQIC